MILEGFVLSELLVPLVVGSVIWLAITGIEKLLSRWGEQRQLPESVQAELSETDREMIDKSRETIKETFGDNLVETLKNANSLERVKLIDKFANDLANVYGLDVTIDITTDDNLCGYYSDDEKKVVFNVHRLMMDSNNPHFAALARDAVDTIVHELRHAVQRKASKDPAFWNVGAERAQIWERNFNNYISPSVDVRAYANQPVEADAVTFAAEVLREVQ